MEKYNNRNNNTAGDSVSLSPAVYLNRTRTVRFAYRFTSGKNSFVSPTPGTSTGVFSR
jgi:hypothetical protein